MKLDFFSTGAGSHSLASNWLVSGECYPLTDVLLCPPAFLEAVPCCSVTRERVRDGFAVCRDTAVAQHGSLQTALENAGVTCHEVNPAAGLPDLCFTRDVAATTPWGLVALNPARAHRRAEVDQLLGTARSLGVRPVCRISEGTIEGGDICIARPGLLIIGCSGERTSTEGAEAFAAPFRQEGWDVIVYHFDPHFLHLDTIFCMLNETRALACVDVLEDEFLDALAARGIGLIPVTYKEARRLGCNILSIDGHTILIGSGHRRIADALSRAGFVPVEVDIAQLSACGGGIHCLTMPLARAVPVPVDDSTRTGIRALSRAN